MPRKGERSNSVSFASKRIAKLTARIDLADHSDPTLIVHGKPARVRARLDRITLKRWQGVLAAAKQQEPV